MDSKRLKRFTYAERVVHWVVGSSFVVLLLTGLAFAYPSMFWITTLLGGGPVARMLHPWIGLAFTAGMTCMFALWLRDMFLDSVDIRWLRAVQFYATRQHDKVPDVGKYNAGQKIFFWVQALLGVVFLITGFLLWFPGGFSSTFLNTMRLVHYVAALGGGLFLIIHVYLGTVAYPGTARGMIDGTVTRRWARLHHPLWYREKTEL